MILLLTAQNAWRNLIVLLLLMVGSAVAVSGQPTSFLPVSPGASGVDFQNELTEDDSISILRYEYFYNGGGVAVADLNQDGYPDLVFTGNLVTNRLYLNTKQLTFTEVSSEAGLLSGPGWSAGVTVADVNGDHLPDIYICRSGLDDAPDTRRNLLYIHQGNTSEGIPRFKEMAAAFGVDDPAFSTQAAFLDYDRDGDLDLFVMNHRNLDKVAQRREGLQENQQLEGEAREMARHKLYRNENGKRFTEVSEAAGIDQVTLGLGLAVSDLDRDGWPDIYVGSDGFDPDLLLQNQGDGTFRNAIESATGHTSFFSMGTDIADINNDGWPDIAVMDMLGQDQLRAKTMMPRMEVAKIEAMAQNGLHYQSMRNVLQLNRGHLRFSEIGQMAGIFKTDWSWACLLADFDLDGYNDLFVTNGVRRDFEHLDFAPKAFAKLEQRMAEGKVSPEEFETILDEIPSVPLSNRMFRNRDAWHFDDVTVEWGLQAPGFSNGAAYGDLDLDGDLDLVINNVDAPASILENKTASDEQLYLAISLADNKAMNHAGIGARIELWTARKHQVRELQPTRGFQSAVAPVAFFGLPEGEKVERLRIVWPDGTVEERKGKAVAGLRGAIRIEKGNTTARWEAEKAGGPWEEIDPATLGLDFRHRENEYDDYEGNTLLPHRISRFGPALATGDVNGDGLTDVYFGGAAGQPGQLCLQGSEGKMKLAAQPEIAQHRPMEDLDALFLDVDGDRDLDLLVASGGPEFTAGEAFLRNRLYRNDGTGNFRHDAAALPPSDYNSSCLAAADADGDGDLDLFIGGRSLPGRYPYPDRSELLRNDEGHYVPWTTAFPPELAAPGMVHAATWLDYDGDGREDLLLAGEWMPLRLWRNRAAGEDLRLEEVSLEAGFGETEGWWWSLTTADLDADGDLDIIAGNLGQNHKFKIDAGHPLEMYGHDFDADAQVDVVLAQHQDSLLVPIRGRQCSADQVPQLRDRVPTFNAFGRSALAEIYGAEPLSRALHRQARDMRSMAFLNDGGGKFRTVPLPAEMQMAPVMGSLVHDWNRDGRVELLVGGNLFEAEAETGRYDASLGAWMPVTSCLQENPGALKASGLNLRGNVREIERIRIGKQDYLLVVNNDAAVQLFRYRK